ncbi:penicillin-binding protein [Piscirickettsia salmonis]|uniref:Peptidoglycan D,D-transpeptidase FtsI n=4 Tax=Piscirickettsia salmonis TaxID=1238 RepID=A0A9Q6LPK8_PISSA|nr:penicillin-binding protein 2 [Piscirickettsia salmonis]ALA26517.1 penicillin-binding transpeptidase domain protein [Piscirickettsia salmonis]APS54490.1 penicillin-binding protein [Piscirickettsia salmonis]ERL63505.1 penicillin binding transpeptidase domain protein [Piscirickettsia salmonis LF-89 = ATCC VR-1361]PEQ16350.1 penicillin-binding protein 2 [Piscirickettsia salmonis]QGN75850.1 Peptidoglycan synthase FtsI precursor [Piscirickettsia salmonis]
MVNLKARWQKKYFNWRLYGLFCVLAILIIIFCVRAFYLQVMQHDFLHAQSQVRSTKNIVLPAVRGSIFDRYGEPLAISAPVYSIFINPQKFILSDDVEKKIINLLNLDIKKIRNRLKKYKNRQFMYLKRSVLPLMAMKVKSLAIPGMYVGKYYQRFYPDGSMLGPLVGLTDIDEQGQEGVELAYNDWLVGVSQKRNIRHDRRGGIIDILAEELGSPYGKGLSLSIDRRIQHISHMALIEAIYNYKARSGSIVVLDAKNSEILAIANYPSFNPNNRSDLIPELIRNRAVTDVFEPGSVIKPFTLAYALSSGQYHKDDIINTSPGWLRIDGRKIHDVRNYGQLTVRDILKKSSNVGIAKMMMQLPAVEFKYFLARFGFGEVSFSGLPGERSGAISTEGRLTAAKAASLGFGYGLAVTTLQLAQAYAVLAAEGVRYPLSVVAGGVKAHGQRVLDAQTAAEVMNMLETVVSPAGTGHRAMVQGFRVAGKTGTVRMVTDGDYDLDRYTALFAGIVPADQPELVVVVVIHDPRGEQYYGGEVAAPVFAKIAKRSLHVLNVEPNNKTHGHSSNKKSHQSLS